MSDDATSKSGMLRRCLAFLWRPPVTFIGTIGVLGLYVLSFGPAQLVFQKVILPEGTGAALEWFYTPMIWASENSEILERAEMNYSSLWIDVDALYVNGINWGKAIGAYERTLVSGAELPEAPPFFSEIAGALLVAWLVWHLVRWVNYRKPSSLPPT